MYKLDASAFHVANVLLQQTIALVQKSDFPANKVMTPESRAVTNGQLQGLKDQVNTLQCPVTRMAVDDLMKLVTADGSLTYLGYGELAVAISNNLRNELTLKLVYVIDPSKADFYEPKEPLFGNDVLSKFSGIVYEIEQSGKCYACDLSTASAFHSIRCLEAGIRAVSRCLGISDPTKGKDRSWFNLLKAIREALDARWPASTGRMSGDAQIFDEIYGALAGMANPYRNATMHLDAKYDAPEALHIHHVVKGFMKKIASRMDENGLPLA